MDNFPSIDRVHEILDEICEDIPEYMFRDLNGGIILSEDYQLHQESHQKSPLYILGQYRLNQLGRSIIIYYGSLEKLYYDYGENLIYEKLREVLLHEFTHHIESLAGERDLELEDQEQLRNYRRRLGTKGGQASK